MKLVEGPQMTATEVIEREKEFFRKPWRKGWEPWLRHWTEITLRKIQELARRGHA